MKNRVANAQQIKNLISFRPDKDLGKAFQDDLDTLEVSVSELASRALKHGLKPAFEEIAAEKRSQLAKLMGKLDRKDTYACKIMSIDSIGENSNAINPLLPVSNEACELSTQTESAKESRELPFRGSSHARAGPQGFDRGQAQVK